MKSQILPIAACIFALAIPARAALVAHYKFDESAGASIAANELAGSTGAVGSAVTTGVAGISGNAYSFGGASATQNDIVDMANASFFSAITTSGQLTISTWVNTTDTTGNRNTAVFAGDNTSNSVYADLGVAAGQAGFEGSASARVRPVGASSAQQTGIFSSPAASPVNDGNWHNLVMTVNLSTSNLSLYVDGVLTSSQTMTNPLFPIFNNFEIGRLGRSSPVDPYQGLIDDVQVYDQALTANEVEFLFNNPGVAVPEPSALALAGLGMIALLRRRRA